MCQASKVTEDWVVKGCHIHIEGVELVVRPDHKGGVCFKSFFAVNAKNRTAVVEALKLAQENCLIDPEIRKRWVRSLDQGMAFMLSSRGALASLANGRMLEFKFLRLALNRYA